MNFKILIVAFALAAIVSFGLGLLNAAVRSHGGTPMDLWQLSLITAPFATIGIFMAYQMRGNRALDFASADEDRRAKEFAADPQRAGLYVFRDAFYGKLIGFEVMCNGALLGQNRSKTFFRIDLAPGNCELVCKNLTDNTQVSIALNVAAGQLLYVAHELSMASKGINQALSDRPEPEGQKRVRRCRMLKISRSIQ